MFGRNTDDNNETWTIANRQAHGEYNHTLTINEMPSHSHNCEANGSHRHKLYLNLSDKYEQGNHDYVNYGGYGWSSSYNPTSEDGNHWHSIGNSGSNWKHNNMPPYIGVYMWERTA